RIFSEEFGNERAKRLAAGVLRASGLAAYTQAGRWAFGMEFLGHLTNLVNKPLDALDPPLQRAFARHGLSAGDWDVIRNSPLEVHKNSAWILPQNVEDQRPGGAAD